MKKSMVILCAMLLFFGFVGVANAKRFIIDQSGGFNDWYTLDTQTGLMWAWDVNNAHGFWDEGEALTDASVSAGYNDWRQPTIGEFDTLFQAIGNPSVFPTQLYPPFNDIMKYYWTGTPNTAFNTADSSTFYDSNDPHWIWPVRTAQGLVQWRVEDGGNGNWYEMVTVPDGLTWDEANILANAKSFNGIQGHLATLTSVEENSWVWNNFSCDNYWLGGYQTSKVDEPSGNWAWVTGESWDFTNWAVGEPNDWNHNEECLQFADYVDNGKWNDELNPPYAEPGYVVEYGSAPVPEPATMLLLGSGLIGLAGFRMKFRKG